MPKVFKPNLAKANSGRNSSMNSPFPEMKSPSINDYLYSPRKRFDLMSPRNPIENSPSVHFGNSPMILPGKVMPSPRPSLGGSEVDTLQNPPNESFSKPELNDSIVSASASVAEHEISNVDLDSVTEQKKKTKRKRGSVVFEPIKDTASVSIREIVSMIPKSKVPKKKKDGEEEEKEVKEPAEIEDSKDNQEKKDATLEEKKARALEPSYTIDADGNIIINPLENKITVEDLIENSKKNSKMVFEDELSKMKSSIYAYRKNPIIRARVWTKAETFTFYRALSTFGQDFSLIQHLFPDRRYAEIRTKFKYEERKNPHLVNNILRNPKSYDLTAFFMDDDEEEEVVGETKKKDRLPVTREPKKKSVKKPKNETVDPDENTKSSSTAPTRRSLRNMTACIPSPKNLADFICKDSQ